MKKVARLRIADPEGESPLLSTDQSVSVRTTGRIKKPKAVFDPSDNYLPRAQRAGNSVSGSSINLTASNIVDRRKSLLSSQVVGGFDACNIKKPLRLSTTSSANTSNASVAGTVTEPLVDVCSMCKKREAKRGTYAKNKLISCLECDKKVHKLCLSMDYEDLDMLRQNYRCENCRTCDLCAAFSDVDTKHETSDIISCSKCVKSYHANCHIPNVLPFQLTQRDWKCNKCTTVPACVLDNGNTLPVKTIREIIGDEPVSTNKTTQQQVSIAAAAAEAKSNALSLKRKYKDSDSALTITNGNVSEIKNDESQNNGKNDIAMVYNSNELIDVPDVKYWSVDQVTEFFAKYFPEEAFVFKEQEIDGMSLLLLKRSDVIKKLPIKLGPSLRIYNLILKIQTQLNDATLGWNCGL